jgi:hypothetical protein
MLEETLNRLADLGQMSMFRHKDGLWSADLQLPAPDGVTAKISSGFGHKTLLSALKQVDERLNGMRKVIVPGAATVARIGRAP